MSGESADVVKSGEKTSQPGLRLFVRRLKDIDQAEMVSRIHSRRPALRCHLDLVVVVSGSAYIHFREEA